MEELPAVIGTLVPIAGIAMVVLLVWIAEQRKEREGFQRNEVLKKIADAPGDAAQQVLQMMRQQEVQAQIRRREGLKLGGLLTLAVGIGLMLSLALVVHEEPEPVWAVGFIPIFVGAALLAYVFFIAPKITREDIRK